MRAHLHSRRVGRARPFAPACVRKGCVCAQMCSALTSPAAPATLAPIRADPGSHRGGLPAQAGLWLVQVCFHHLPPPRQEHQEGIPAAGAAPLTTLPARVRSSPAHPSHPARVRQLGSWAVVTGATDGIGLALAKEIAKKGVNVVLVSRSLDKLRAAEKEVKEKAPSVQTKTIAFDFSKGSPGDYAKLASELKGLDIGVLYNNVGVSYEHAEVLQDLSDERIEQICEVNNASLVKVRQQRATRAHVLRPAADSREPPLCR